MLILVKKVNPIYTFLWNRYIESGVKINDKYLNAISDKSGWQCKQRGRGKDQEQRTQPSDGINGDNAYHKLLNQIKSKMQEMYSLKLSVQMNKLASKNIK